MAEEKASEQKSKTELNAEKKLTHAEWHADGVRRFGPDQMKWKFVCPACNFVQSVTDYKKAGAEQEVVGFSCVGRYIEGSREAFGDKKNSLRKGPCNYAGGGLFRINPVAITFPDGHTGNFFDFAEADPAPVAAAPAEVKA